jgi:hypothetical protein
MNDVLDGQLVEICLFNQMKMKNGNSKSNFIMLISKWGNIIRSGQYKNRL